MSLIFAAFFCVISTHVTSALAGGRQGPQSVEAANDKLVPFDALPEDIAASGNLKACLNRKGGTMSGWRHSGGAGLDYGVLATLAEALG